jgi:hypothetical protein
MKFSTTALITGLATMVNAKAAFTNSQFNQEVGVPFTITWMDDDGTGPYYITLRTGPATNLGFVMNVGCMLLRLFLFILVKGLTRARPIHQSLLRCP